jgi:hypothetical protein
VGKGVGRGYGAWLYRCKRAFLTNLRQELLVNETGDISNTFAIIPQAKGWIEEARAAFAHIEDRSWASWGGKILFPELFAQIKADREAAAEAAKKAAEEEVRREAEARERVEEDRRRRADEEHKLKIISLQNDTSDRIDEAYEKVSRREMSYDEMKMVERQVDAELAPAMQELVSGVEAGGKAAAGVHGDGMDLDTTPVMEKDTPPVRKPETKRKRVEFVADTGPDQCERCERGDKECFVPEGDRRCHACNMGHQACSFARPRKADDVGETRAKKRQTQAGSREASGSSGAALRAGAYVGKPLLAMLSAEATRARAVGELAASGEDTEWLEARRGAIRRDILILRNQIVAKQGALAVLEGQLARLG